MATPHDSSLSSERDGIFARIRMPFGGALLDPLVGLGELERLWTRTQHLGSSYSIFDALLRVLDVRCAYDEQDLLRIPSSGPVAIVANHPCGLLDGPVVASAVHQRRSDIRFLANSVLSSMPELRPYIIPVEVFGNPGDAGHNASALLAAYRWLRGGGVLVAFPAGEVSSVQFRELRVADRLWDDRLFRLFRSARATLVPVYLSGANSVTFHVAGFINPALRTALLGRELLNKRNARVTICFGSPVHSDRLSSFASDRAASDYVRARTYLLQNRTRDQRFPWRLRMPMKDVIQAVCPEDVRREMENLPQHAKLASGGHLEVHLVDAAESIPSAFRETARLRELAFRTVGEGTGNPMDRDAFDAAYQHLILWDRLAGAIVGGYRMARIDRMLDTGGPDSLYTSTLFHLKPEFLNKVRNGIELGRSFVRPEYQKDFQPLYLLWKAIAAFVAREPKYRYLIGPASISAEYSRAARELIVKFCAAQFPDSGLVQARRRVRSAAVTQCEISTLGQLIGEPDELSAVVSDVEPDRKPLPVLFRQYLALGGRVVGFNVDPAFSGTLDGLVVVDLMATKPAVLARYMGKQNAAAYRAFHKQ